MFFIEEMHELCLLYSLSFWRCTAKVELLRRAASFRSEASSEAQAKRRACAGHRAIQKCHGQSDGWLYKMPCHSKTKCHSWKKHEHIMNNDIINYHHHCRKSELVLFLFMIFYIRLAMILQELAANKEITTAGGHGCCIPTSQVRREVILGTSGSARIKSRIKALLTGNWMLLVLFFRSISLW